MKTRLGFVTNSSSSSFILAYNEDTVVGEIWKQLVGDYGEIQAGEYLGYLMEFLNNANNEFGNLEEFFSNFAENVSWEEGYEYREELERNGMNYKKAREIVDSEEGKEEIKKRVQKRVDKLRKDVYGFDTVKKINISDDYEPLASLEYRVVRDLKECKDVKSCH